MGGFVVPRRVAELATAQDGVVGRTQLLALGARRRHIDRWLAAGWLHGLHEGVYAVGHRAVTVRGRHRAALLASGPQAALSHLSACAHLGLLPWIPPVIDVTVPRGGQRRRDGLRFHRPRVYVAALDTAVVDGLRCSTVARAVVDAAGVLSYGRLERVVEQAEFRELLDLVAIARVVERLGRPRGVRSLRRALGPDRLDAARAGSQLERAYLRLVRDAGIEKPVLQHPVELTPGEWAFLDCFWPAARLNVEVDGPHHRRPLQARRDARRDRLLRERGIRVQRFSDTEVERRPSDVVGTTRALLRASRDD